jgi:hypothetical protein
MNLNEGTWKWIEYLPRVQDIAVRHIKYTPLYPFAKYNKRWKLFKYTREPGNGSEEVPLKL